MLAAVKEEPVKEETMPIDAAEMAGSEPNVPHVDNVEEVAKVHTMKKPSYTKQRSQTATRPRVGQLRPKGVHVAERPVKIPPS